MNSKPLTSEDIKHSVEVMRELSTNPSRNKTTSKKVMFDFHKGKVLQTIEPPYFYEGLTEQDLNLDSSEYGLPFVLEPGNSKTPVILGMAAHLEHARLHDHVRALEHKVLVNTSHGVYGKDDMSGDNIWDVNVDNKDLALTYKHNLPLKEVLLYEKLVHFANYNKREPKPKPVVGERKKLSILDKEVKKKKNNLSRKSRKANRK